MHKKERGSFVRLLGRHWLFIALSLVSTAVYLAVGAFVEFHNTVFPPHSPSVSGRIVTVPINGQVLNIPRHYLVSGPDAGIRDIFQVVRLEAMLPDFRPLPTTNGNERFRLKSQEHLVSSIVIHADLVGYHIDSSTIKSFTERKDYNFESESEDEYFYREVDRSVDRIEQNVILIKDRDMGDLYVLCTKGFFYDSCEYGYVEGGLEIDISFPATRAGETREIIRGLRAFVATLRSEGRS